MGKYYRKSYRANRDKYSVEQTSFNASLSIAQTTSVAVVAPSSIQGMRKVKHLTVSAAIESNQAVGVLWALMYVPQGMSVPALSLTTGQPLVEPNQFVMATGVFDNSAGPTRIRTPLSRNLNSGDAIYLLMTPLSGQVAGDVPIFGVVQYAITLQ